LTVCFIGGENHRSVGRPLLSDSLAVVLNMAVGNVAPNLSSKNKEIYQTAMDIITALMQNIGNEL
jgi:hypothetical protein